MKFETTLKEVIPRTSDVSSFRFPRPDALTYKAGQYMLVTIRSGEKELFHAFSFSSSPSEKEYIEFTKKFTSNEFSSALKTLVPGSWARIDAPYGKFTFEGESPKIALLTGGIGITPFRSIIKYSTDMHLNSSIALFYGCRTPRDMVFKDELEQMQNQNPNLRLVFTANEADSEWRGSVGNITADLVKSELPDFAERVFYACGPPGMIQAMTNLIKQLGLPESQLKLESFAGYT